MHMVIDVVSDIRDADMLVTAKNYFRRKPQKIRDAEDANLPIYVLRSNTPGQVRQLLHDISPAVSPGGMDSIKGAIDEAEQAVEQVKSGEPAIELSPQSSYIRRLQHLVADKYAMSSQSAGKEPNRRVKIYRTGSME